MKHSPAPFTYDNSVGMIFDANGRRVADLNPNECEDDCDIPTEAEGLENADLFLAAPDMLTSMAAILPHAEQMASSARKDGRETYVSTDAYEGFCQAFALSGFRTAIAKATGVRGVTVETAPNSGVFEPWQSGGTAPAPAPAVTVAECLEALNRCVTQLSRKRPRKLDFDLELAIATAGKVIAKAEGRA